MGIRVVVESTLNFEQVSAEILAGLVRGQNKAAEALLADSEEHVPVDWGTLGQSGTVVPAKAPGEPAQVVYDTVYAAAQHEGVDFVHTPGRNGEPAGEAKFLEKPLLANGQSKYLPIIAKEAGLGLA